MRPRQEDDQDSPDISLAACNAGTNLGTLANTIAGSARIWRGSYPNRRGEFASVGGKSLPHCLTDFVFEQGSQPK